MAERFEELSEKHTAFIQEQHIYFVGTAAPEGLVNVSPKGMDSFRVLDKRQVAWLNLTGSGNETAAHLLESSRMTVMFCSFERQPMILRLYGNARAIHLGDKDWKNFSSLFPASLAARQIFVLDLSLVQTSCGYGVPFLEWKGERPTLKKWEEAHDLSQIKEYWREKNTLSLDDKYTGIFGDE